VIVERPNALSSEVVYGDSPKSVEIADAVDLASRTWRFGKLHATSFLRSIDKTSSPLLSRRSINWDPPVFAQMLFLIRAIFNEATDFNSPH
jgi:hypothetical protein